MSEISALLRRRDWRVDEVATPRASIKRHCRECMGWDGAREAVEKCTSPACWLFPWRTGKAPPGRGRSGGPLSEAQRRARKAAGERLRKMRAESTSGASQSAS